MKTLESNREREEGIMMTLDAGKRCPVCEVGILTVKREDVEFSYHDSTMILAQQDILYCQTCGESFLPPHTAREREKILTDARRKVDGLLTSEEIKAIRQQFRMTQTEFAHLLRVGKKTFARYENGQITQSYAMDDLLRILRDYPETIGVIRPLLVHESPTERLSSHREKDVVNL